MTPTVAVVLSGCGVFDGSEIHETVLTLLAVDKAGGTCRCFAPDMPNAPCVDHRTRLPRSGGRNPLEEAARLSRGPIQPLNELENEKFDALILPGGYGAVTVLSSFAAQGAAFDILPALEKGVLSAYERAIPIGCICIASLPTARILRHKNAELQLACSGDEALHGAFKAQNARPVIVSPKEIVVDHRSKIVSTPAYLATERIADIDEGIRSLVQAVFAF